MGFLGDAGDWIADAYEGLIDPGADDRRKASKDRKRAEAAWTGTEELITDEHGQPYRDAEGNKQYRHVGGVNIPGAEELAFTDDEVATGMLDRDAGARYIGADEKIYTKDVEDLDAIRSRSGQMLANQGNQFNQEILAGGGFDAVAEAEYERRRAQAQNTRQANAERVMRDMELRGLGGGGAEALGALSAGQGQAQSEFQGGLVANAQRQANREAAAAALTRAGEAQQATDDAWLWDTAADQFERDTYNRDQAFKADQANADKITDAKVGNTERGWAVDDANAQWGQNVGAQRIGATQGTFNNEVAKATGLSGAISGTAAQNSANAGQAKSGLGVVVDIGKSLLPFV